MLDERSPECWKLVCCYTHDKSSPSGDFSTWNRVTRLNESLLLLSWRQYSTAPIVNGSNYLPLLSRQQVDFESLDGYWWRTRVLHSTGNENVFVPHSVRDRIINYIWMKLAQQSILCSYTRSRTPWTFKLHLYVYEPRALTLRKIRNFSTRFVYLYLKVLTAKSDSFPQQN